MKVWGSAGHLKDLRFMVSGVAGYVVEPVLLLLLVVVVLW